MEALGRFAGVPVWNGLTDQWHPTQMVADILTMQEHCAKPLDEIAYCYLGDARNNTAQSLLVTGALLGMDVRIASPVSLQPDADVQESAEELAFASGARLTLTEDVVEAVRGADFIYTDVWLSMGEPVEAWGERIRLLIPYQVTTGVLEATAAIRTSSSCTACRRSTTATPRWAPSSPPSTALDALEVTDDVFESGRSIVFDQAENRLHTIKAIMVATLGYPE